VSPAVHTAMAFVAVLSLIGTVANVHQLRWGFLCWLVTNAAWVAYDIALGAWPQAALMAVYWHLALYGYIRWGRAQRARTVSGASSSPTSCPLTRPPPPAVARASGAGPRPTR